LSLYLTLESNTMVIFSIIHNKFIFAHHISIS
jgi:hypothetical protein